MAQALPWREDFVREHSVVLVVSVLAHLLLLVLLGLNLDLLPEREVRPVRLAIQGTVVDRQSQRRRTAERERELRQAETRRVEERRQEQVAEQQQIERERELTQQRLEAERAQDRLQREAQQRREAEADQQRVALERKRTAEAEQKRQAAEKRRQAEAEQKTAAAETRRKTESERREAQSRAELARQLAEEEAIDAAASSGLLDEYVELIRQKVQRNWIKPASARPGIECRVTVRQIPGGEVVEARVGQCNGDAAVVRSIEAAVLRSSPLPLPSDPKLFERNLEFVFKPEE